MVEIKNLALTVGGRSILRSFSLRAPQGKITVVAGPSGSGKTTLLKAMMGFVSPESGSVHIGGETVDGHSIWGLRRLTGYVPQKPDMGEGTLRDALMRPFGYRAASGLDWDEGRVMDVFDALMLDRALLGQDIRSLSGGEMQRAALASALLLQKKLLLLDEPTSGLDRRSKRAVLVYLRQSGLTVLAASHDDTLIGYADEVAYLGLPVGGAA